MPSSHKLLNAFPPTRVLRSSRKPEEAPTAAATPLTFGWDSTDGGDGDGDDAWRPDPQNQNQSQGPSLKRKRPRVSHSHPNATNDDDESYGAADASKAAHQRRKNIMYEDARRDLLKADPWALEVEEKRVRCRGCHKWRKLDRRNTFYRGLWEKHRDRCPAIKRLKGEDVPKRVWRRKNSVQAPDPQAGSGAADGAQPPKKRARTTTTTRKNPRRQTQAQAHHESSKSSHTDAEAAVPEVLAQSKEQYAFRGVYGTLQTHDAYTPLSTSSLSLYQSLRLRLRSASSSPVLDQQGVAWYSPITPDSGPRSGRSTSTKSSPSSAPSPCTNADHTQNHPRPETQPKFFFCVFPMISASAYICPSTTLSYSSSPPEHRSSAGGSCPPSVWAPGLSGPDMPRFSRHSLPTSSSAAADTSMPTDTFPARVTTMPSSLDVGAGSRYAHAAGNVLTNNKDVGHGHDRGGLGLHWGSNVRDPWAAYQGEKNGRSPRRNDARQEARDVEVHTLYTTTDEDTSATRGGGYASNEDERPAPGAQVRIEGPSRGGTGAPPSIPRARGEIGAGFASGREARAEKARVTNRARAASEDGRRGDGRDEAEGDEDDDDAGCSARAVLQFSQPCHPYAYVPPRAQQVFRGDPHGPESKKSMSPLGVTRPVSRQHATSIVPLAFEIPARQTNNIVWRPELRNAGDDSSEGEEADEFDTDQYQHTPVASHGGVRERGVFEPSVPDHCQPSCYHNGLRYSMKREFDVWGLATTHCNMYLATEPKLA